MNALVTPSVRLIAISAHRRYDHSNRNTVDLIGAHVDDKAELERRLNAGERLSTGEAAKLLETSRWTVDRILSNGTVIDGVKYEIGYQTLGRNRELDPDDLKRVLGARRKRRGSADAPTPE